MVQMSEVLYVEQRAVLRKSPLQMRRSTLSSPWRRLCWLTAMTGTMPSMSCAVWGRVAVSLVQDTLSELLQAFPNMNRWSEWMKGKRRAQPRGGCLHVPHFQQSLLRKCSGFGFKQLLEILFRNQNKRGVGYVASCVHWPCRTFQNASM